MLTPALILVLIGDGVLAFVGLGTDRSADTSGGIEADVGASQSTALFGGPSSCILLSDDKYRKNWQIGKAQHTWQSLCLYLLQSG